jgi:3-hydroxyacyl-[acyl-carrier-protein] dehydratase
MDEAQLQAALDRLPHGAEFRFVDRLLELEPGKSGVGEYRVRGEEAFLPGHFPGEPLMPGVLLVEAVAQLAGVVAQSDPTVLPLPGLKLTGLRQVKILGSARPGETLRIEARVVGRLGRLIQAQGQVKVKEQVVPTTELTLAGAAT